MNEYSIILIVLLCIGLSSLFYWKEKRFRDKDIIVDTYKHLFHKPETVNKYKYTEIFTDEIKHEPYTTYEDEILKEECRNAIMSSSFPIEIFTASCEFRPYENPFESRKCFYCGEKRSECDNICNECKEQIKLNNPIYKLKE